GGGVGRMAAGGVYGSWGSMYWSQATKRCGRFGANQSRNRRLTSAATLQRRVFGSHGSSTTVSKPWARLVPRETSGLAEMPTVVMPARLACSAQVTTSPARYPHAA